MKAVRLAAKLNNEKENVNKALPFFPLFLTTPNKIILKLGTDFVTKLHLPGE